MSDASGSQAGMLTPGQRRLLGSPGPTVIQRPYDILLRELEQLQGRYKETQEQLEEARRQIMRDNTTIQNLQAKIAELEELIQKQKITISNQSKTISDPKGLRRKQSVLLPVTPHRQVSDRPSFDTPFSNRAQNSGHSGIFDLPPPRFDLQSAMLPQSTHDRLSPAGSLPSSQTDFSSVSSEFASRFRQLWLKTERFGQIYGNVPNIYQESHVEKRIKEYIMTVSDQSNASYLLGSNVTRFLLFAKAINFYLVRDVLKISIIKGFNGSADTEIGSIKKHLFPDTPTTVRNMMFIAMANQINKIKKEQGFREFFMRRLHDHTAKLWQLVGPLTHTGTTDIDAYSDLSAIVSEAQAIALDMYSTAFEYKFEFPVQNDLFVTTTMVNRDSFIKGDPSVLMKNQTRVKLGITPITRMRDNSGSSPVQLIHLSHVLLKPPAKQ